MAKISQQSHKNSSNTTTTTTAMKVKRTRKSVPRDSPPQRSSIYRGVTRHRWTGRYEAHLWDKNCWNEAQNKKGRQGAYDDEEAAAHAYDLAALKYWGHETILNFPVSTYEEELKEMEGQSREEYIGSLRRKSSGFSRGVSKYRGVARHHHNGIWEARIGRVFGNKYLYLGTYATQEAAATAYDMAAIEYRGVNAVTNFDLSRYVKWLRPNQTNPNHSPPNHNHNHNHNHNPNLDLTPTDESPPACLHHHQTPTSAAESTFPPPRPASRALGILLQSSKFKEMLEWTSADCQSPPTESEPPRSSFPDDIQTFFDCQDSGGFTECDDITFGDLSSFASHMFQGEFDA
ncbi:AP2-like ethylene-responsive transcription factor [Actinidia chinensis var. chinensis]|uniref:AP2-like ethylene-responsive transcription factor n=1 Tax=Actinidia chinensis var. chinensis TaxID=1590841 RepID=A0A2R6PVM9_ACTCC|nr:AP2-like ethylene-responsive transcription factor [Actinidia chinensis var. chinensis]